MSILTEDGIKHLKAPYHGITEPGTKRVIYAETDCVWVTYHPTHLTDVNEIEQEILEPEVI